MHVSFRVLFLLIYWVTDVMLPYGRPAWWAYFASLAACQCFCYCVIPYVMFVWRINSLSLSLSLSSVTQPKQHGKSSERMIDRRTSMGPRVASMSSCRWRTDSSATIASRTSSKSLIGRASWPNISSMNVSISVRKPLKRMFMWRQMRLRQAFTSTFKHCFNVAALIVHRQHTHTHTSASWIRGQFYVIN